jgi:trigger factor
MESQEQYRDNLIYQDLMNQLYTTCTINDYPEDLVNYGVILMTNMYKTYASYYGMDFGDFLSSYYGMTEDDFAEAVVDAVKQSLEQELILKAIAEEEDQLITDEEFEEGCESYAETYGYESGDALREDYDDETITTSLLMDKVLTYVKDQAVVTETSEEETETEAETAEALEAESETETESEAE